jgi:hypothetical protein
MADENPGEVLAQVAIGSAAELEREQAHRSADLAAALLQRSEAVNKARTENANMQEQIRKLTQTNAALTGLLNQSSADGSIKSVR